ncbi:hypothetical protein [Dokdonella soli]|uniref:Uncharacterized protein n=1 Tax=Dokdonella soli TaxID=529810 RepID=A0ABP3THY1_9GAMM
MTCLPAGAALLGVVMVEAPGELGEDENGDVAGTGIDSAASPTDET